MTLTSGEGSFRSWSLKMVPLESLCTVSYSHFVATMAVSSVSTNGVTLKTGLRVVQSHRKWRHSIDHCTTYYLSDIVNSSILYRLFFYSFLTLNNTVTLKSGLEVTQDHSNWYHSKAWVLFTIHLP